jgi:two-component system OmpR family response regulator
MHRILLIDDDEQLGAPLAAYCARFELELVQATRPSARAASTPPSWT